MRYSEIIGEALSPREEVVIYSTDGDKYATVMGGRIVDRVGNIEQTLKNINLKNVRSPNGPLLFHGSISGDITKFNDYCWLSAEPNTAITHAEFNRALSMGKTSNLFVCYTTASNPLVNPDIVPGKEKPGQLEELYRQNPDKDCLLWKNTRDVVMPITDLYNVRYGKDVVILKNWSIRSERISHDEWEAIMSKGEYPDEHKKSRAKVATLTVDDPALTHYMSGDKITPQEYEEYKDYGLTVK
jgi:hypothetical protein